VIDSIWEELVEDSLIETEATYFNKWFVQFNSKEAEKIVKRGLSSDKCRNSLRVLR
jgi:hypothetical protein